MSNTIEWRRFTKRGSNTRDQAFLPSLSLLEFDGTHIVFEDELKIVGITYDRKMNWSAMISEKALKGRQALGCLFRVRSLLTDADMAIIYKSFVRSVLEYGCLSYMAGAPSSLRKLDQVQARAEKLSNKIFQELGDRRLAAVFGFFCKLTGTDTCINSLSDLCPEIESKKATGSRRDDGRSFKLKSKLNQNRSFSLENFKRSFMGEVERVFDLLPTEIINEGINNGWPSVMKKGQKFLSKCLIY